MYFLCLSNVIVAIIQLCDINTFSSNLEVMPHFKIDLEE